MREFHFERELFFVENRTRRNDQGLDREGPDADPAMDLHSPAEHDAKIMPRLSSKRRIKIDTRWERSDQDVQDDRLGATTRLRWLHVLYGPRARSGAGEPSGLLSLAPTRLGGRRSRICTIVKDHSSAAPTRHLRRATQSQRSGRPIVGQEGGER